MAKETKIVVVGAGVTGLTTALLLSKNPSYKITVIAKHQPGDMDIEYASPWAGANYVPVSLSGSTEEPFERGSWPYLEELAKNVPESGIHFLRAHEYFPPEEKDGPLETEALRKWRSEIEKPSPWMSQVLPDWQPLGPSQCPSPYPRGVSFQSVCINPQVYLPYLQSACVKAGVTFRRVAISHIGEASRYFFRKQKDTLNPNFKTETADIIINCTGLSSHKLGGIEDKNLYPIRGQIVLVQEEVDLMIACADIGTSSSSPEELCYIMSRGAGGGTVLGGSYQVGNWDGRVDPAMSERILRRAARIMPTLVHGQNTVNQASSDDDWKKLTVVRESVGLRPARKGGIRLDKVLLQHTDWEGWVINNFGHGGYGYHASYGCALKVLELVDECTAQKA